MAIKEKIKKIVFVGMSGGVDSSVVAGLLKQATPNNFKKLFGRLTPKGFRGYDVVGVHLRCFNLDGCADRDLEDARRAAEVLDIPFYVWDYEKEYKKDVMQYMIDGYKKGITPNPDVMCNKEIKFGLFLEKALEMGADYVATGHYVRLVKKKNLHSLNPLRSSSDSLAIPHRIAARNKIQRADRANAAAEVSANKDFFLLSQACDQNKDQSYFLWTLTQKQLKHCLFPLGDLIKPEVRKLAQRFGLLNAAKKDSQGICFLGKVGLEDFLKKYIKPKKGNIVDIEGNVLGRHEGVFYYTIGQRHGLRLDKVAKSPDSAPYYVADKILKTNTLVVAQGENNPALFKKEVKLANVNLISPYLLSLIRANRRIRILARVRYRQPLFPATLVVCRKSSVRPAAPAERASPSGREFSRGIVGCKLMFDEPVKFVAIGQSAVFYLEKGEMLGGGIII